MTQPAKRTYRDENDRLRQINAELLAALKTCRAYFDGDWDGQPEDAERIATQKVRRALEQARKG